MAIRISVETSGSFTSWVEDHIKVLKAATTVALRAAGEGLKTDLRRQIDTAFPGSNRARNMVGIDIYPAPPRVSFASAVRVYPRGRRAELVLEAFAAGVTITARNTRYLAIPTEEVPNRRDAGRSRKMSPVEVEAYYDRDLVFVQSTRRGVAILVLPGRIKGERGRRTSFAKVSTARKSGADKVMFILTPRARLPKVLDPDAIARRWLGRLPDLIDRALPRN